MDPLSLCFRAARGAPCVCPLCHAGAAMPLLDLPPDALQAAEHDCFEGAARCALRFLNVVAPVRVACEIDGTDPRVAEAALRRIGLCVASGEMTVDDLRHHAECGRPVLLLVHWPGETASHWVVSRGVSRGKVFYHDPDSGRSSLPVDSFLASWQAADARMSRPFRQWGISCWVP